MPEPTALYRFFDRDGQLLYVGITKDPKTRWDYHRLHAASTWWPSIASKQVQWFPERSAAAAAELRAIRTEAPLWNSAGAPNPSRGLAPGEQLCPQKNWQRFREQTEHVTAGWLWFNLDVAIAVTLTEEVRQGVLSVGDRLPSTSAMINRFGVSLRTIRQAVQLLREDGVVTAVGAGSSVRYFITEPTDDADWRPPKLPDGRDALDALLAELRADAMALSIAADRIGLHLSVARGWIQRHPILQHLVDEAWREGWAAKYLTVVPADDGPSRSALRTGRSSAA